MNGPNGDYQHPGSYNAYPNRGSYPPVHQSRPGMGMPMPNSSPLMPPASSGYAANHQRNTSVPGMPQACGQTPTLNQLLQNSNGDQRFPSPGYGEYGMGHKSMGSDMGHPGAPYGSQGWSNNQRPMNPYQQQQMAGNPSIRNHGGPGYGSNSGSMGYTQSGPPYMQSSHGQGGVMPSVPPGQMSPQSKHHSSQPSPGGPLKLPSDDVHSRPSSQHSDMSASHPPPSSHMSNGIDGHESNDSTSNTHKQENQQYLGGNPEDIHNNHIDSQQRNPDKRQPTPSHLNSSNPSSQQPSPSLPGTLSAGSATSSGQQQHGALRPPRSPAGSTGSRSTTPHSVTGQAPSPMPPRPPSNQVDGPGRITSPMNPAYNPQMMPPPMGPSQMGYGGPNKMANHPNMMPGSNQMGGHYNQPYPGQQGSYGRGPPGMSGYGGQPNYPNGPNQMCSNQMVGGV